MDLELAGRSLVVTGGSSGIGLATAELLVDAGAFVTICGRDSDRLRSAEAAIGSLRLRAVPADVTDIDAAAGVVDAAVDHGGRLDGVAAIAGYGRPGSLLELEPAAVVEEVSDKLLALLNVARPAIPHLRATNGAIVGLVAPTGFEPVTRMGAIGVGRAAIANAIRALSLELAADGVRVNAVGVGLIDTPRQRDRHAAERSDEPYDDWLAGEALRRGTPLGRAGTDREVAAAVGFLLSPVSSFTTGAVIDVTGGHRSH